MANFNLQFSPEAFVDVLPLLGKGMLGVFVVICAIWAWWFCLISPPSSKPYINNKSTAYAVLFALAKWENTCQNEPWFHLNTLANPADTMKTKQCLPQEEP